MCKRQAKKKINESNRKDIEQIEFDRQSGWKKIEKKKQFNYERMDEIDSYCHGKLLTSIKIFQLLAFKEIINRYLMLPEII